MSVAKLTSTGDLATTLVVIEMITLVLTQKLALPLGDSQIQISLAVHLLFLVIYLKTGFARISAPQTLIYLCTAGIALLLHSIITTHGYSVPSLLSFMAIYVIVCFVIPLKWYQYEKILLAFQLIALLSCSGVWIDWVVQFCGSGIPNIEPFIPKVIRLTFYVYLQPVVWGSPWTKPNAIIFPETSFISGFLGIALIIEVAFFRRLRYLLCLGVSLLATMGGSGMLLVVLVSPFLLGSLSLRTTVAIAVSAAAVVLIGLQFGALDSLLQRSQEFSNDDSSAYHRFVEPITLIGNSLSRDTLHALFGSGAGNAPKGLNIIWSPMAKAIDEYGLIFGMMFLIMTISFMFGAGRPFIVALACFLNYHLLGGGFVMPWFAVLAWILVGGYHISPDDRTSPLPEPQSS